MKSVPIVVATLFAAPIAALAQTPVIQAVLNPATLAPPVAPGMPVLVNGSNLAGAGVECRGPQVPLTCGSVTVTVNNRATPVRIAYPTQVMTYIPVDQAPGSVSVVVTNHLGVASAPFSVRVERFAPGIQNVTTAPGSTTGFFSDASQTIVSRAHPATPGEQLTAYAVGLGPTLPVIPAGETGVAAATTLPVVWIGNRPVPALSSGLRCAAICEPGVYLVDFLLPADIGSGDQAVSLEIGGVRSSPATLIVGTVTAAPAVGYLQSVLDPRVRAVSPGVVVNVVGGGFLASPGAPGQCATEPNYWPTTCLGLTVTISGRAAPLQWISSSIITLQIPFETTPGTATLIVERASSGQTLKSAPFTFTVDAYSPTLPASSGAVPYAGVVVQNSGGVASPSNPLLPGDDIFIFAAGLGQTNPPMVTGFGLTQPARTVLTPTVTIAGKLLDGIVSEVLPGMLGQYRISARVPTGLGAGDLPIVVEIGGKRSQENVVVPVAKDPVIAAVVNSASGIPEIASGSWVSIYGRNLSATRRQWREEDILYDWLPTTLDGVEVAINNTPAVVAYVSPTQLNVLAPDGLAPGTAAVTVKNPLGWQQSKVLVKAYAPGLLPLPGPPGPVYLLATHTDWSYVAPNGLLPPTVPVRPAEPGETIVFYGTGLGATTPAVSAYHRFAGSAPLVSGAAIRVSVGSAPAQVAYAGMIGNGLYQLNVVVPDLPSGDHEVIVSIGGESSPRGRFIPVRR